MTCQFKTIANIVDLYKVKQCLFHPNKEKADTSASEVDPWDWNVKDNETQKPATDKDDNDNWVNECLIALSPTGEILVLAHIHSLVILVSKWDSQEESTAKTKYHIGWNGEPQHEFGEKITAVVCLPLAASQDRSAAHCGPDWTCIAVGFSSGALRFYTEAGALLFSEVLHEEPITGLKCQSYQTARFTHGSEQNEELHVSFRNTICCIFGLPLCNTLRACRHQLARVQANCSSHDTMSLARPLSIRKFSIPEQGTVSDTCVGPMQCPPGFTHLVTASICGGFNAWYRPSPPQSSLVLAVGTKPFVGFHSAIEGSSAPVLTDVAKAMATKLKSAIGQAVPGWLLGAKKTPSQQEKVKEKQVEPAEPMACRFGLCDLWRQGEHIVMSPNRKLSVVSDTLGRVILIDNSSGIALRMWKGYRDAECGWIMCNEEKKGNGKRVALFLVIYSPKKGVLEVWATQQGPRIATFSVSKTGRLIYVAHNLFGTGKRSSKENSHPASPCIFIEHTGALKEITVPFHCALSDKYCKRARDVLLLKKLKSTLREDDGMSEVCTICKELQTDEMRMQSLDLLCSSNYITANILSDVLSIFTQSLPMPIVNASSQAEGEETVDPGGKLLMEKIQHLEQLITFYQFLAKLRQKPPTYDTIVSDSTSDYKQELCKLIQATPEEIDRVLSLSNRVGETSRVKFEDNTRNLSTFLLGFCGNSTSEALELTKTVSSDKLLAISELVCQGCLDGNCSMDEWQNAACESRVSPTDLMRIALTFWLSKQTESTVIREMIRFSKLIKAICLIAGKCVQGSEWWSQVRATLRDSENPLSALAAALICRSVATTMEDISSDLNEVYDEEGNKEGMVNSSSEMEWENVSQESCQWSQLISQLEDIAFLHSILSHRVDDLEAVSHTSRLKYEKPNISLGLVLSKGKGCIPEMVAKWISCSGLDPTMLLESASLETPATTPDPAKQKLSKSSIGVTEGVAETVENSVEAQPTSDSHNVIIEDLAKLREHFPYSLASNSLLANLCWEYVLAWIRDVDSLTNLLAAINCLNVIPDPHVRKGICTMIWSMHLMGRFGAALRLINKVGKVAKERLCRQDVGLSDFQIADFFNFCSNFIDVYMESNVVSEVTEKSEHRSETLWEGCAPVPSLTQLALSQPTANYDLLQLLSQAARAMLLLTTFGLRTHRPLAAFFDSNGQAALFSCVWSKPQLPGHSIDPKLTESRTKFLLRGVSAAMGTIVSHQQQEWDAKQAIHWMSQCLSLAADWSIPVDPLRRQQVCQLYAKGFDRLAEEIIPAVNDSSLLGSQLLVIAGQRLNKTLMSSSKDLKERITNLSPALSKWINELADGSVESSPLSETSQLACVVLSLLHEDHPDRNLARQLSDSLQHLAAADNSGK